MAKYTIQYSSDLVDDLSHLRVYEIRRILDVIEQQLLYEPMTVTRNRKLLFGIKPPWEHVPPIWELRIGNYRVFYDVDEIKKNVSVRALRYKPPDKTTEEIL
jgi:mRNA-degrading endonuclease RelE of RelBE toxin-antitoxin system